MDEEAVAAAEAAEKAAAEEQRAETTAQAQAASMPDPPSETPSTEVSSSSKASDSTIAGATPEADSDVKYPTGTCVDVARHTRIDERSEQRKTVYGGVGFVTAVHKADPMKLTFDVRYILGGSDSRIEERYIHGRDLDSDQVGSQSFHC